MCQWRWRSTGQQKLQSFRSMNTRWRHPACSNDPATKDISQYWQEIRGRIRLRKWEIVLEHAIGCPHGRLMNGLNGDAV